MSDPRLSEQTFGSGRGCSGCLLCLRRPCGTHKTKDEPEPAVKSDLLTVDVFPPSQPLSSAAHVHVSLFKR